MRIIAADACGHMGQILCDLIRETPQHELIPVSLMYQDDPGQGQYQSVASVTQPADCIIDFSHHNGTANLCAAALRRKIPLVIATTGQTEDELRLIRETATKIPVFYSGNMSMGIALLVRLARETARLFPQADIEIVETHHNRKEDVPSGTALMLANAVKEVREKARFVIGRHENGRRQKEDIGIHSLRMANIVGTHEVIVATPSQVITLKHEALDRRLFAEGALAAAEFLVQQAPGLYDMSSIK